MLMFWRSLFVAFIVSLPREGEGIESRKSKTNFLLHLEHFNLTPALVISSKDIRCEYLQFGQVTTLDCNSELVIFLAFSFRS